MDIDLIKKKIEKISIDFIINEPFYGYIFKQLKKIFTEEIKTIGINLTDNNIELIINPIFIKKLSMNELKAVLIHEILHVCYKHVIRCYKFKCNAGIYNIASDLSINQKIQNLPDDKITISNIFWHKSNEIEINREAEYYYNKILKEKLSISKYKTLDGHDQWYKKKNSKIYTDKKIIKKIVNDYNKFNKNYNDLLNDTEINEIKINKLLKNAFKVNNNKFPGTIPGDLLRDIGIDVNIKYKKKWNEILRNYLNKILYDYSYNKYKVFINKKRPNKKLGFPFPSIKIHIISKPHIAVCIDASGSINQFYFNKFMNEINCMYNRGIILTLLAFDTEVKEKNIIRNYNPSLLKNNSKLFPEKLGGGTNYIDAIEKAKKLKPKPHCIVFFTDSYDMNNLTKPDIPIIFILSARRNDFYSWAKYIFLDEIEKY